MKTEAWLAAIMAIITFGVISVGLVAAQQTTDNQFAGRHYDDRRPVHSITASAVQGADRVERRTVKAGLAHAGGASKGRAQYPPDHG